MIIFMNNMSTKITYKRFIHKREVVPFFLPHGVELSVGSNVILINLTKLKHSLPKTVGITATNTNLTLYNAEEIYNIVSQQMGLVHCTVNHRNVHVFKQKQWQ